jgi:hypothetical protein
MTTFGRLRAATAGQAFPELNTSSPTRVMEWPGRPDLRLKYAHVGCPYLGEARPPLSLRRLRGQTMPADALAHYWHTCCPKMPPSATTAHY